jgi:hypothetical protein
MDTINVFAPELRGVVRKEIPFIPGAWVEFFDDVTGEAITSAEAAVASKDINQNYLLLLSQIKNWNFADQDNKPLAVTLENLKRLNSKFITWMSATQAEILTSEAADDKKKE